MDTHNNEQGIVTAKKLLTMGSFKDEELYMAAQKAIGKHELIILKTESKKGGYD